MPRELKLVPAVPRHLSCVSRVSWFPSDLPNRHRKQKNGSEKEGRQGDRRGACASTDVADFADSKQSSVSVRVYPCLTSSFSWSEVHRFRAVAAKYWAHGRESRPIRQCQTGIESLKNLDIKHFFRNCNYTKNCQFKAAFSVDEPCSRFGQTCSGRPTRRDGDGRRAFGEQPDELPSRSAATTRAARTLR
jgi:hypothetical protein